MRRALNKSKTPPNFFEESSMKGIYVTVEDLKDALLPYLDHAPTHEQLENFIDYVRNDIYEWLRDNAKSFVRRE